MKKNTIHTHEEGQSLIEFSMSLVFLLILLAGVADFGRAFLSYIIVRDAAQEGAVYGAIAEKTDLNVFKEKVKDRVKTSFINPSDPNKAPLNVDEVQVQTSIIGSPCAGAGNSVRVTVNYVVDISTPFLGTFLGTQEIPMRTSIEDTILSPLCP